MRQDVAYAFRQLRRNPVFTVIALCVIALSRALMLTVAGLTLGLAAALALSRYLETLLFEIKPADPLTLAAVSALLLVVATAAALVPTTRATKVDPMVVVRYE